MADVLFNLEDNSISQWARPDEFFSDEVGGGKEIAIVSFKRLSREKGETDARYVDSEGYTYRLTFLDREKEDKTRMLEIHARTFKDDLASAIMREFKVDRIKEGQVVILRTFKGIRKFRTREKEIKRWDLVKVEKVIEVPSQIDGKEQ